MITCEQGSRAYRRPRQLRQTRADHHGWRRHRPGGLSRPDDPARAEAHHAQRIDAEGEDRGLKLQRFHAALLQLYDGGLVRIPEAMPGLEVLLSEFSGFPDGNERRSSRRHPQLVLRHRDYDSLAMTG